MDEIKRAKEALKRFEAAYQQKIEERLASGELVRSTATGVILSAPPDFVPPEPWIERVENGPDILHDNTYIITGGPRAGDDDEEVVSTRQTSEPVPTIERPDRLPPPLKQLEPEPPPYVAP